MSEIEVQIVDFCRKNDCLSELCDLVDYDPDIGRVPEHWVPKLYVLELVRHFHRGYTNSLF